MAIGILFYSSNKIIKQKVYINFFFQSFLTAINQNYSRKHLIPIDLLTQDINILTDKEPSSKPENGAYIKGVYLTGARWDRSSRKLAEQFSNILFDQLPVIFLFSIEKKPFKHEHCYMSPLYITSERRGILSTTGEYLF